MNRKMRSATILGLAIMTLPVALQAQRGAGPRQGGAVANPVAPLINMRRQLDLTPRQLVQLDSIERALVQRNRAVQERLRAGMDSLRPRGRQLTDDERAALRTRADSLRTLRRQIVRNDSIARAGAMRVLTDSQRTRVQVRQAELRGFAAGRAAAGRGQRGFRPGAQRQQGAVGRMQPRARMGAGAMRPGMGQQGRMGMQPRMQGRPPMQGEMGPMGGGFRRMGPPDGVGPMDEAGGPPLRRRMMGDVPPPDAPAPPARRPPVDTIK